MRQAWTRSARHAGGLAAQSVNILFQVCLPPSWARPRSLPRPLLQGGQPPCRIPTKGAHPLRNSQAECYPASRLRAPVSFDDCAISRRTVKNNVGCPEYSLVIQASRLLKNYSSVPETRRGSVSRATRKYPKEGQKCHLLTRPTLARGTQLVLSKAAANEKAKRTPCRMWSIWAKREIGKRRSAAPSTKTTH